MKLKELKNGRLAPLRSGVEYHKRGGTEEWAFGHAGLWWCHHSGHFDAQWLPMASCSTGGFSSQLGVLGEEQPASDDWSQKQGGVFKTLFFLEVFRAFRSKTWIFEDPCDRITS